MEEYAPFAMFRFDLCSYVESHCVRCVACWSRSDSIFILFAFFFTPNIMINSSIAFLSQQIKSIKTYYFNAVLSVIPGTICFVVVIVLFRLNGTIISLAHCVHAGSPRL